MSSSKYKGVCWDKRINRWLAQPYTNGKQHKIGTYKTELEAHNAVELFLEKNPNIKNSKSSKYKYVSWDKCKNKWIAYKQINGKQKTIGLFKTELEAHNAVQAYLNETTEPKAPYKYKGITWSEEHKKFRAETMVNGKPKFLGYYKTEAYAISAIRECNRRHNPELNFHLVTEQNKDKPKNLPEIRKNSKGTIELLYKGKYYTYVELSKLKNILPQTLSHRIKKGYTVAEAVEKPVNQRRNTSKKLYVYKNKKYTILELAKLSNKDATYIYRRIHKGMSVEDAIGDKKSRRKVSSKKITNKNENNKVLLQEIENYKSKLKLAYAEIESLKHPVYDTNNLRDFAVGYTATTSIILLMWVAINFIGLL